jgi:uncharacterized protein YndB with AHSA1/START domain
MGAADTMVIEVQHHFPVDIERVWMLLTDIERMAGLGPENVESRWTTPGRTLGAQFTGRNVRNGREWTMPCTVDVYQPPTAFGWAAGDPGQPTAWWRYDLVPGHHGGTDVAQRFTHGPGFSYLRRAMEKYPNREAEFVQERADELAAGMRATLSAAAALLEARQESD